MKKNIKSKNYVKKENRKLIYTKKTKNPFILFWNFGWNIYYNNQEIWNYLIVGILTTIVALATYYGITRTILNVKVAFELQLANMFSWVCAVIFAYITNRIYVFKSKNKNYLKEILSFVGTRIISLLMDMVIMLLFVTLLGFDDIIGKIISQVVVTVTNYVLSKLFVFKKNKTSDK